VTQLCTSFAAAASLTRPHAWQATTGVPGTTTTASSADKLTHVEARKRGWKPCRLEQLRPASAHTPGPHAGSPAYGHGLDSSTVNLATMPSAQPLGGPLPPGMRASTAYDDRPLPRPGSSSSSNSSYATAYDSRPLPRQGSSSHTAATSAYDSRPLPLPGTQMAAAEYYDGEEDSVLMGSVLPGRTARERPCPHPPARAASYCLIAHKAALAAGRRSLA
jgi:hypothetical protein